MTIRGPSWNRSPHVRGVETASDEFRPKLLILPPFAAAKLARNGY